MPEKKKPIGQDPFDSLMSPAEPVAAPAQAKSKTKVPEKELKERLSALIPVSLVEEVRYCVVQLQGPPVLMSVSKFVEDAAREKLEKLRADYNDGKPFEGDSTTLPKRGRPVGKRQ